MAADSDDEIDIQALLLNFGAELADAEPLRDQLMLPINALQLWYNDIWGDCYFYNIPNTETWFGYYGEYLVGINNNTNREFAITSSQMFRMIVRLSENSTIISDKPASIVRLEQIYNVEASRHGVTFGGWHVLFNGCSVFNDPCGIHNVVRVGDENTFELQMQNGDIHSHVTVDDIIALVPPSTRNQ